MKRLPVLATTGLLTTALIFAPVTINNNSGVVEASTEVTPFEGPFGLGEQGAIVERTQEDLNRLGYETDVDGIFGPDTEKQIMKFQEDLSLEVTGIVDVETSQALTYSIEEPEYPAFEEPVGMGDRGEIVEMAQEQLNRLGYGTAVDGIFGPETEKHVMEFQEELSLEVDGIVNAETYQALMYSIEEPKYPAFEEPVRMGDRGEIVESAQEQLNRLGYGTAVDGIFGPETEKHVMEFQEELSLEVDGVVGAETYQALMYSIE
ncbi:peptidoglycan-binding domain-containing protein [Alkalihalobacillus trypoxylicola]|uniref:Peptidoglycan binding-like domain-containing protein n=1 Tax=Alkalihalobacillus trypoxylicola TaxID=519424 RepID=A0A161PCS2_9BACI|nr:peptidoglycan-binding protein [Alkalihalobacillus trypoxylicola]KYG30550.1 hypothetical protein AZF04_19440 [Alkalihalobacillus trypoxylicola]